MNRGARFPKPTAKRRNAMIITRAVIAAVVLTAPSAAIGPVRAADPAKYSYIVLGQGTSGATLPMARFVIEGVNQPCPSLTAPGQTVPMTPRTNNPNVTNFPVTVCEALYPTGQRYKVGSIDLPSVSLTATPERVVVLGDTGCRPDKKLDCDPTFWPFAGLAARAVEVNPDLLVHVGDYNYRGTPGKITLEGQTKRVRVYDAGDADDEDDLPPPPTYYSQNMATSTQPDTWAPWQKDFFEPAKAALHIAPWIFVRGNHELCSRAGPGFLYFLDPGSKLPGSRITEYPCPNQDGPWPSPLFFGQPYQITVGNLVFAVIDTANAGDKSPLNTKEYNRQLESVVNNMDPSRSTFVLTHRPFWGIKGPKDIINVTLESALSMTSRLHAFPSNVVLVVSGHMHRFQAMGFIAPAGGGGRPPQLIVGTGGVGMSTTFPIQHHKDPFTWKNVAGATATGVGLSKFGLLRIDVGKSGAWTAE